MNINNNTDFYGLLGIGKNASDEEIKKAYRKKALMSHPDREGGCEELFKNISHAYTILTDPQKRSQYDDSYDGEAAHYDMPISGELSENGVRLSQTYKNLVDKWISEYHPQKFYNNLGYFYDQLSKIIAKSYPTNNNPDAKCLICNQLQRSIHAHNSEYIKQYKQYIMEYPDENIDLLISSYIGSQNFVVIMDLSIQKSNLPINLITKKWDELLGIMTQFSGSLDILSDKKMSNNIEDYCGSFDQMSSIEKKQNNNKSNNFNYTLKSIEYPTIQQSVFDYLKSETSRRLVTNYKISVIDQSHKRKELVLPIHDPPGYIPDNQRLSCMNCNNHFKFFYRRHHCRLCGDIYCNNCMGWEAIHRYGYHFQVRICNRCSNNHTNINCLELVQIADNLIENQKDNNIELIHYYLSASFFLSKKDTNKHKADEQLINSWQKIANKAHLKNYYPITMQCYKYIGVSTTKWLELARDLCSTGMIGLATECIHNSEASQSDLLREAEINHLNCCYALTCYIGAKLSIDQLINKVIKYEHLNVQLSMSILGQIFKSNTKKSILELGQKLLSNGYQKLAFICLKYSNLTLNEWILLIEKYIDQTSLIIKLIKHIHINLKPDWKKIPIKNVVIQSIIDILYENNQINYWISRSVEEMKNGNLYSTLIRISIMKEYLKVINWNSVLTQSINDKNYEHSVLIYKVMEAIDNNKPSLIDFAKKTINSNKDFSFYVFQLLNQRWDLIGDEFFNDQNYDLALECYLKGNYLDNILNKAQIMSKDSANINHIYKYYINALKKDQQGIYIDTILVRMLSFRKDQIILRKRIAAAIIKKYGDFDSGQHVKLHLYLCESMLSENKQINDIILGCLHFISKFNLNEGLNHIYLNMINLINEKQTIEYYNQLNAALYEFSIQKIVDVMNRISNSTKKAAVQIISQHLGNKKLEDLPNHFRVIILVIKSYLNRLDGHILNSVKDLQNALLCYPCEETFKAITQILSTYNYRNLIHQESIKEIITLLSNNGTDKDRANNFFTNDINPPKNHISIDRLQLNTNLRVIKNYEMSISTNLGDKALDAVYSYIDLCMAVKDPTVMIGNFMMGCAYLVQAIKSTKHDSHKFAYWKFIYSLCLDSYMLTRKYLTPSLQTTIYRNLLNIMMVANQLITHIGSITDNRKVPIINRQYELLTEEVVKNLIECNKISPVTNFQLLQSLDLLYSDLVGREYVIQFLEIMSQQSDNLLPQYVSKYHLFDGAWKGWITQDDAFLKYRESCMRSLLEHKGWNFEVIKNMLDWPLLTRVEGGWLSQKTRPLNLKGIVFSDIEGLEINIETGQINLLLVGLNKNEDNGLFNMDDIRDALSLGVTSSFFTLDQPDAEMLSHPFQEMKYAPKNLAHTNYLATLLHTDYLLKMISTDVEVSSQPPFLMRSASEGFLKRLPGHLLEALKPIHKRKDGVANYSQAHRFWIEAGKLYYTENQQQNKITFKFGNLPMVVKKHLLKMTEDGKLIDNDEEENEESPEAEFVSEFTQYYDQIGQYFPELLRLKTLVKLGAVNVFINSIYQSLKNESNNMSKEKKAVEDYLSKLGNDINYPLASNYSTINKYVDEVLSNNNVSRSMISYSQLSQVESNVKSQLQSIDDKNLQEVTNAICKSCEINSYNLSSLVHSWLSNGYKNQLLTEILEKMKNNKIARSNKLRATMNQMGIKIIENETLSNLDNNGECVWVPAAFCIDDERQHHRIYGGVNLGLNLAQSGGNGGNTGSSGGGMGGMSGGAQPRYVVSMDSSGKVWGTMTAVNSVTGASAQAWKGYQASESHSVTQRYWQPTSGGNIHHTTLHKDGTYNVHHNNGGKTVYK